MDATTNLSLPYIMAAQAQKHVTHNEALRVLDAAVQLGVEDRDLAAPPGAPAEGTRYIVAASATGAWSGHSGQIAAYQDGAWAFCIPREGWVAWIRDEDRLAVWDGSAWIVLNTAINPVPMAGINATADTTNRLAVSSDASLFNHAGHGHQHKINKAGVAETASIVFQTGFSGRAEIGTTQDDDFHFKVSANGSAWSDALVLKGATGTPRVPNFAKAALPSAVTAAAGSLVHVSDETGGAVLAFSDGTNWRRVTDRAVVS